MLKLIVIMLKHKTKIVFILSTLVIATLAIGYVIYTKVNTDTQIIQDQNEINYQPPTEAERSSGDERKKIIDETENNKNNNVEVVIVDAGQYDSVIEVRAFVQGVIEGGNCLITFSQGTSRVNRTIPAFIDATTTQCENLTLNRSDFPNSGEWSVVVQYASDSATGISEAKKFNIN